MTLGFLCNPLRTPSGAIRETGAQLGFAESQSLVDMVEIQRIFSL